MSRSFLAKLALVTIVAMNLSSCIFWPGWHHGGRGHHHGHHDGFGHDDHGGRQGGHGGSGKR
jgi:hypothetical protein